LAVAPPPVFEAAVVDPPDAADALGEVPSWMNVLADASPLIVDASSVDPADVADALADWRAAADVAFADAPHPLVDAAVAVALPDAAESLTEEPPAVVDALSKAPPTFVEAVGVDAPDATDTLAASAMALS